MYYSNAHFIISIAYHFFSIIICWTLFVHFLFFSMNIPERFSVLCIPPVNRFTSPRPKCFTGGSWPALLRLGLPCVPSLLLWREKKRKKFICKLLTWGTSLEIEFSCCSLKMDGHQKRPLLEIYLKFTVIFNIWRI